MQSFGGADFDTHRLLLIDDDPSADALVRIGLAGASFDYTLDSVRTAASGRDAILAGDHHLYLVDYWLPDGNGVGIIREARSAGCTAPLILLTGSTDPHMYATAFREGASDYLEKEQVGTQLERAVRYALERAQAEAALRASEARYRTIVESEPACVTVVSPAGLLLEMNPAGLRLMEATRVEQVRGRAAADFVHPDDRERVLAVHRRAVRGESCDALYRVCGQNGRVSWVESYSVPFGTGKAGAHAVLSLTRDVTERRQLEQQLLHSQKMEAIGRLAGGVAHDFNNLLTAITGYCELLSSREADPARWHEDLANIRHTAERGAKLARQLLILSRRELPTLETIDVNDIVSDMAGMLPRLLGEDVAVRITLDPRLPAIRSDRAHMEQVLLNLLINARDAMPAGGTLRIETHATREHDEPMAALVVADTGVGMDAATQQRIFEPFFTTKPVGEGTGLGLSTVYGIVEQSRGRILVESTPDAGTAFTVLLPALAGRASARRHQRAAADTPRGSETILLVEDEPAVREVVHRNLESLGYRVLPADSLDAAVHLFRTTPEIGLVLTDLVMPGGSGRDLVETLRAGAPGLRVIFMSGYAASHRTALQQEPAITLQKPFTREELARRVRHALDAPAAD